MGALNVKDHYFALKSLVFFVVSVTILEMSIRRTLEDSVLVSIIVERSIIGNYFAFAILEYLLLRNDIKCN
jgi:hypothetical protein